VSDSPSVSVSSITSLSLTVEYKYSQNATRPLKVHIRSSDDGLSYDTVDVLTFENGLRPGQTARRTVDCEPGGAFIKVLLENSDSSQGVSDLKINATLRK